APAQAAGSVDVRVTTPAGTSAITPADSFTYVVAGSSLRTQPGFSANTLPANDDGSTGAVALGFTLNFFGTAYSTLYVNNNGNVTFGGPLSTYTPYALSTPGVPIIAPFFADVDTNVGPVVTYGQGVVDGHAAFAVNWLGVGYYSRHLD